MIQFLIQNAPNFHCGGKAVNLFELQNAGFRVPAFVVIPAEVLSEIIDQENIPDKIFDKIRQYQIPNSFLENMLSHFPESGLFAVRSSAVDEDGKEQSFAGQFESYLYVNPENLENKIKSVWCSAFSERVILYRQNNGLSLKSGLAVIVQEMVNADVAGVGFGIDPVKGNRKERLVCSVFGLGEGIVSGELNADTFTIKTNGDIESRIAHKTHRIDHDKTTGTGTIKTELEKNLSDRASLSPEQVLEIGRVLWKLYQHYQTYQDIEFAYSDHKLYLLQTRPVTTLGKIADTSGDHIVWDNSNIIESYPGMTSPLTFSFINKMYQAVYIQLVKMMGVTDLEVEKHQSVFANMLGLLNGRVYYNLINWYATLALLPGYALNAGFMEKMMGVKEKFELTNIQPKSKLGERLRILNMIRQILQNWHQLPTMRRNFQHDFEQEILAYKKLNLEEMNPGELMGIYSRLENTILKKWKAPLVNDFFAMIFFGVLQKLVTSYGIDENATVHNDLMCGARNIISTEPVHRCLRISQMILKNDKVASLFQNLNNEAILPAIKHADPAIYKEIDMYLQEFGNRCVGELKLETITYSQKPSLFMKVIRSYVEQGLMTEVHQNNVDIEMRKAAEEKVNTMLKNKPLKRLIFQYFLHHSRILVSSRENLRFERTRAFGMVRDIFTEIGKKFYSESLIHHSRDIFYLTKEEIFDFIQGSSVNYNLKDLIEIRKNKFFDLEKLHMSERIDTFGIVYLGNNFIQLHEKKILGNLKGLGCCPGHVKARVRVVIDPNEVKNLNGDILVTSNTDPGWVTLFPSASAILVERGSLLSHSAIVSREMGKPCIVGISGLLDHVKTGDLIEMDGRSGEIQIVKE